MLEPAEHWQDGLRSALSYRVADSGMTVAVVADHVVETENEYNARTLVEPDIAKNVFRVQAKAGVPITVTKLVSYHTSRGVPPRELVDRCRRSLDRAADEGVETVFQRQRAWLDAFWERSDVQIGGRDDLQQATRWCLFQLASGLRPRRRRRRPREGRLRVGIQRTLLLGHRDLRAPLPHLHDAAVGIQRTAGAGEDAPGCASPGPHKLNEAGALLPWRTINGEEASAYYAGRYRASTTSTPTSASRSASTCARPVMRSSSGARAPTSRSRTARLWATLGFWRASRLVEEADAR